MTSFIALMKREFWEHKRTIIWPPAVIAFIVIGLAISLLIAINNAGSNYYVSDHISTDEIKASLSTVAVLLISNMFLGVCGLTVLYYLVGALYNDRKDRSILFWKSLPSTELQTILSKLLTGMLTFPAIAVIFSFVTVIIGYLILSFLIFFCDENTSSAITQALGLSFSGILNAIGILGKNTFHITVLAIPVFCYLLFISSFSRRSPTLFAILPYIVIVVSAPIWASFIGRDSWIIHFFENYMALIPDIAPDAHLQFHSDTKQLFLGREHNPTISDMLSAVEFWIMMVVSAGLLWAATYFRKRSSDLS